MNNPIFKQPVIVINLLPEVSEQDIAPLFYAIEEEGIPFQLSEKFATSVILSAYAAANDSALAVGIAVSREQVIVHYKNLPAETPLFILRDYASQEKSALRLIGCNAARLVKGQPFKTEY